MCQDFLSMIVHFLLFFRHSSKAARGRPYAPVPGGPPQCKAFTDLPHCVFPMLIHLGPHLSSDPILMAKILRISKGFMKDVRQFLVQRLFKDSTRKLPMPQMELNLDLFSNFCETVWNPYSGSSPMYQDFSMCHDRPVKTAIVDFSIRLNGILKPTSNNLLSLLEAQNKDLGAASQWLLIRVTLYLRHTLTRKALLKNFYDWGFSRPYSVDNDVTVIFT